MLIDVRTSLGDGYEGGVLGLSQQEGKRVDKAHFVKENSYSEMEKHHGMKTEK